MNGALTTLTLILPGDDEANAFFAEVLGFELLDRWGNRWGLLQPAG